MISNRTNKTPFTQNTDFPFFIIFLRAHNLHLMSRSMAEVLPLKNFPRKHALIGNGGNSGGGGGGCNGIARNEE